MRRRGLSEAMFALAVPAWHRIVHRTVFHRNNIKIRCGNHHSTPYYNKYGPHHTNRNCTVQLNKPQQHTHYILIDSLPAPPPPPSPCKTNAQCTHILSLPVSRLVSYQKIIVPAVWEKACVSKFLIIHATMACLSAGVRVNHKP